MKMINKNINEDKTYVLTEILALGSKRKKLILKVLGQLYKGKVGNLYFKNGGIFKVDYYEGYTPKKGESRRFNPFGNFEELKEELLKNLHDISNKFNKENLSVLQFLMNKMDMNHLDWNMGITAKTDKKIIQMVTNEIKQDIQEIKDRCANYLLIMAIEEENVEERGEK